jgi:hypothetical protein
MAGSFQCRSHRVAGGTGGECVIHMGDLSDQNGAEYIQKTLERASLSKK